ncbi:MAG TPA: hypothetical protein VHB93_01130 [Candidatus Paceibacterota bacterium]|nr:hypothetical protein [Candidatus Paceibacterota bacterium]
MSLAKLKKSAQKQQQDPDNGMEFTAYAKKRVTSSLLTPKNKYLSLEEVRKKLQ